MVAFDWCRGESLLLVPLVLESEWEFGIAGVVDPSSLWEWISSQDVECVGILPAMLPGVVDACG